MTELTKSQQRRETVHYGNRVFDMLSPINVARARRRSLRRITYGSLSSLSKGQKRKRLSQTKRGRHKLKSHGL